jgi:hypothetical protein
VTALHEVDAVARATVQAQLPISDGRRIADMAEAEAVEMSRHKRCCQAAPLIEAPLSKSLGLLQFEDIVV